MNTSQHYNKSSIEAHRWQPSAWFRMRTKLAPAFSTTATYETDVTVPVSVEPPTPTVHFEFPRLRLTILAVEHLRPDLSGNLLCFDEVSIAERDIAPLFPEVDVSDDLFVPLRRTRDGGRTYAGRPWSGQEEQPLLQFDSTPARDKDGYRKSFTEQRDRTGTTRRVMTIWDLILPLLEPPLSLDFPEFFYLPSPLYPFQFDGVRFLAERKSALLGDDMGTGKTVQTIVAIRILLQKGAIGSTLIVVPLTVLKNWDRELLRWAPCVNGVTVVRGPKAQRDIQWEKPAHIWISTYGNIRSDIDHILKHRQFDLVVLDEIQAIKNRSAQQARAVKRLPRIYAWGLSGTPIQNTLEDLSSIFDFLKPGLFPREAPTPQVARGLIKPYFLRRRKEDVLDELPDKKAFDHWLGMEDKQRAAYDRAETKGRVWLEERGDEITVQHVLALLHRLKILCNHDPESGHSAKLDLLDDMLEDAVAEDSKVLVFSQYLNHGVDLITDRFAQYQPAILTGKVRANDRERAVERFQNDDACKLLVATQKTGGIGLNLVAGNYVFHFDHWWNPATARQAEDRVHRIGQTKDVFVYHLWTEGTIEERIHGILKRKQRLYSEVFDELSNVQSTGLSEEELFELFDLKSPRQRKTQAKATGGQDRTLAQLLALDPREFESTIKQLYQSLGFAARLTPESQDAGVDVIASRVTLGGGAEKYAIQCKRYAHNNKVGRPEAQKLLGVLAKDSSFTKGVLITTSEFSAECRQFASDRGDLELIDGARLIRWMRETDMCSP